MMWSHAIFFISFGIINCQRVNLSCAQIRHFVNGHNIRRQNVTQGLVPGQPPASNMQYMVWDEELAEKAARWAQNGLFSHNSDRTVPSRRWSLIGENIFISKFFSTLNVVITPNIEEALNAWFTEHLKYRFQPYTLEAAKAIGHYTQMMWADSTRLGCGISQSKENGWVNTLFVCDYGPAGNLIGQTPYKSSNLGGSRQYFKEDCARPYGVNC